MNLAATILLPLPFCAALLCAQEVEQTPGDRAMQAQELRLQEQRAAALRTRLLLYSDELQKLRGRLQSQKNDTALAAVDTELAGVSKAIRTLSASAVERLTDDPPEDPESEKRPSPATVLARRVDAVIRRLGEAKRDATLAASDPGKGRTKVLKIEDAKKHENAGSYGDGRDYWISKGSAATWTLNDVQPGTYEVEFRYTCGKEGGKATVNLKAAGQTLTFNVPEGTSTAKKMIGAAQGQLKITDPSFDLRVSASALPSDKKYCWDLREVVLRPAALARPRTP